MKKLSTYTTFLLVLLLAFFVNIISEYYNGRWDLTAEHRYSITDNSKAILKDLDEDIFIEVLLDGDFEAGFKKLKTETKELLKGLKKENSKINFTFTDPNDFEGGEGKRYQQSLIDLGIKPTNLRSKTKTGSKDRLIYPYAIIRKNSSVRVVNLLENQVPGMSDPLMVLNNSISLLEYKFVNTIKSIINESNPVIAFTEGHGELNKYQTADIEAALRGSYSVGRINLDSTSRISDRVDILMVAAPRASFSYNDQFKIDQFIMNGGKAIFMLDMLNVDLDSLRGKEAYVPFDYNLQLNDMFFKYGARVKPNMVMDLDCAQIPLNVGQIGSAAQTDFFNWYYFPRVTIKSEHPIVKNLGQCILRFPSSIDTVKTKAKIKKTTLLASSKRTRMQFSPSRLNFDILHYEIDPTKFDKGIQNFGVLLEGKFESVFQGRMSQEKLAILDKMHIQFLDKCKEPSKILIISDGRFIRNDYDVKKRILLPAGYYKFEDRLYANKDLILNAIEYMSGSQSLVQARTKKVRLRMIDTFKAQNNRLIYRAKNLILPLFLLALFGLGFQYYRKKRFL